MANGAILGQTPTVDAYTKEQTLTAATAALYGLGADAVPSDVLAWIGKYNQHWWRRRKIIGSYVPVLDLQYYIPDAAGDDNYIYCGRSSNSTGGGLNTEGTVRFSDALDIDSSGRIIGLKEPVSTVTLSYNKYTNAEVLKGKYLAMKYNYPQQSIEEERGFMYVAPTATITRTSKPQLGFVYSTLSAINMATKAIPGDWEFLQSSDRDAYPDSGEQGGYEYQYLGIPFENAASSHVKIATGSYTGTGKYGSSNPNSLTFDGKPLLVIVRSQYGEIAIFYPFMYGSTYDDNGWTSIYGSNLNSYSSNNYSKVVGNTLSWYSTKNESEQLNSASSSGSNPYGYIAFFI